MNHLQFVCGWANAADAIEILCISFLLPTARDPIQYKNCSLRFCLRIHMRLGLRFPTMRKSS